MRYVIQFEDKEKEQLMGGKARAIAQAKRAGFPVPKGFILAPAAFTDSLTADQHQTLKATVNRSSMQAALAGVIPSPAVMQELRLALQELCPYGELVAVRSSASEEDGIHHSFAGQLESFVNISPEFVAEKIAAVWRSNFGERALNYRREKSLSLLPHPPSVLIQHMVYASAAGVAFAADPVSGRRSVIVISAVSGLATSLVSGESDADTYRVDRNRQIIEREIVSQEPVLTDEKIQAVANLVRKASQYFYRPQDIEWAIAAEKVYLLQSRPITALSNLPDPDGIFQVWDNSNIAESYSGITSPLTFSFARRAYEEVYRQFCYFMGVPAATINRHSDTFSRMIGSIQGRVYYNLLSWYRVLALLPGFTINRRFMEQMMGVREPLPETIVAELQAASWQDRLQDSWRLFNTVFSLIINYFSLPYRIRQFYQRLDKALNLPLNLEELRVDELGAWYRDIERQLLTRWDAPLINDFFAMIFYGLLRRLAEKWCRDRLGTLQNDLLEGIGGIISTEPAQKMREMAAIAASNSEFFKLLASGSLEEILQAMKWLPQFKLLYDEYLEKFGDRCLEELKLESPSLHSNPLPLLRAIAQLSAFPAQETLTKSLAVSPRTVAEKWVKKALQQYPLRSLIFNFVLQNAREKVRDRENLRFERTRVFGCARRVFLELGKRLYALDLLSDPRDIFYLEVGEVLAYLEGTATCTNLRGLAALRQAEFAQYRDIPAPRDRFETRGIPYQGLSFNKPVSPPLDSPTYLQGIGCSPGTVKGHVRIIFHPQEIIGKTVERPLEKGCILVAERTDPGWILLFPAASGLLVERGSLLSHAAIVARELGIPAIVSLAGATQWLKDGDLVELDGNTGRVSKL